MADDDKGQTGAGPNDGAKGGKVDGDGGSGKEPTTAQLQGIVTAQLGSLRGEFKAALTDLQKAAAGNAESLKELAAIVGALANTSKPAAPSQGSAASGDADGQSHDAGRAGGNPRDNAALLKMTRELERMQTRLDEAEKNAREAKEAKERAEFERAVKDSLREAGCKKPDAAFRVICDMPKRDEESGAIIVPFKHPEHGDMTLDLNRFVEDVVRTEMLPELFGSRVKGGPDAGGSHGGRGGKDEYDVKFEEYSDPNWLKIPGNEEKLYEADRLGRVEPPPEEGSFSIRGGAPNRRRRV